MAKRSVRVDSTSQREYVFVNDSTSTTGAGKTGIAFNASGIKAYYIRPGGSATAITLATQTVTGAYSSGGWVEVDSTNMPGVYRFDIPNAVFASGVEKAIVMVCGATGMAPVVMEYELTAYDPYDTVRLGLTALPNVASGSAGAIITSGTGTAQLSVSSGNVTVGTNNDKTGYSLTQSFPTNFSSLAITAGGSVTAGTVSDKTGYSLASSQTFSTTGSVGSVTGSVGSVTGAVGSVTGNVGGNVAGSVGSVTTRVTANTDQWGGVAVTGMPLPTSGYTTPPTAAANASAVRTELTTELARLDANVSTRLASASYTAAPSANDNADALLDRANAIDGLTPRQALRLDTAALVGKVSGAGTNTVVFTAADGSKTRITATTDNDGNRSAVVTDAT